MSTDGPLAPEPGDQRESHPGAAGPEGLSGDLGISSERSDDFEGVEGTGSSASTQGRTDGVDPVVPPEATADRSGDDSSDDDPDVRPDPVANKHDFDPSRNPGH